MRPYLRTEPRRSLAKDEAGGVLAYMSVLIPVMMGVIGLAVDASRLYIVNTEQKDMADAAAIAGAYELDGEDDAIVRATLAAQEAITNNPKWATDAASETPLVSIRFCQDLTGDPEARECDGYTTEPKEAYHIEVITEDRSVSPSFLVAVGAVTEPESNAIAIAGSSIVACNVQPLMICNPFEATGGDFEPEPGQMIIFRPKQEGGNELAPGNFTLVDPPDQTSSGASDTRDLLSKQSFDHCYANRVNPRTGLVFGKVVDGINVRFDYKIKCEGKCDADLTAAPLVIKRQAPQDNTCKKYVTVATSKVYPEDVLAGRVVRGATTIGTGEMSQVEMDAYWNTHHGGSWPEHDDGTPFTRYEAYLAEIDMAEGDWIGPEEPAPQCLAVASIGAARRTIAAAIVNCLEWEVRGNSVNQIRADKYAEFFITKPATADPGNKDSSIYTEFVRMMTPDDDNSKLKHIVQLYR